MTSEIVQGKAAWARLKRGSKSWSDWVQVGRALLEGRTIAMRNAGTTSPAGRGYADAFSDWLIYNRFDLGSTHRAKLLIMMNILPEIEAWRETRRRCSGLGSPIPARRCTATGRRPRSGRSASSRPRCHRFFDLGPIRRNPIQWVQAERRAQSALTSSHAKSGSDSRYVCGFPAPDVTRSLQLAAALPSSPCLRSLRPILVEQDRDHDHRAGRDHHRADHRQFFEDSESGCPPPMVSRKAPACHTHSETPFGPQ